jgi:hypothetical protein
VGISFPLESEQTSIRVSPAFQVRGSLREIAPASLLSHQPRNMRHSNSTFSGNTRRRRSARGKRLIRAVGWMTHLERDAANPITVLYREELSRSHTFIPSYLHPFIPYELRGNGLSGRNVSDMPFSAWAKDLEAVVNAAGVDQFHWSAC